MNWKLAGMMVRILSVLVLGTAALVGAQEPYAITGVPVDPRAGSVPLRKSINELQAAGGPQWDLYIRSLIAMYDQDPSDTLSYFQISSIHGRPFIEWNGGGANRTDGWGGYCPHSEKIFLPWHRTYTLLFEQVLVENAKKIALEYPQRYRYQYTQAAETLRAPFWDWASEHQLPPSTVPEKIRVNMPSGEVLEQTEVDNPLATYKLPEEALRGDFGEFDSENRTQTYRCRSPKKYPESANENVSRRPYRQWVYDAFTRSQNYSQFASTGEGGISLEQIHNGMHWDAACGEQFLSSELTAFDPLFMMHHCNVDRLWTYWQFIEPDHAIFLVPYSGGSRFSTPRGEQIGPDSPLNPFFNSDGELHTTRSTANIRDFGYSYQGLEYWEKSDEEMRQEAKRMINRLYGPDEPERVSLGPGRNSTTRYFARVEIEVSEVDSPCVVELYLENEMTGHMVVMEQPSSGVLHGEFPLDQAVNTAGMQILSADQAIQSIQSSLQVSIVKRDNTIVPLSSVPGLKIAIEDVLVTYPEEDDELPIYEDPRRTAVVPSERIDPRRS